MFVPLAMTLMTGFVVLVPIAMALIVLRSNDTAASAPEAEQVAPEPAPAVRG